MVPTWRNSFFLNLEKTRTIQGQVRTDIYNDKQTNDETEISTHIFILFSIICIEKRHFLMLITIQSHFQNVQKSVTLDGGITEKELLIALQSMENKKSPRNDGLTRVLYIAFRNEIKISVRMAIEKAYLVKQFSAPQKQPVIK